jgi:2-polyprenyl-3-methyl-5-hydroxy-6-metoxy-1,4-benzoquinol methylase
MSKGAKGGVSAIYEEFSWNTEGPANGLSGERLADATIALIRELAGVRKVCDLGCGNGYLAGRLAGLGYLVTGVDASQSGIALAQGNNRGVRFLQSTIGPDLAGKLGETDYDLIVSSDVIEHLYRPGELLEAAYSLAKPGGQLVITTPYHGYLKNLALSLLDKWDAHFTALSDGAHIKFFSVETLSTLVTSHDFKIEQFRFFGRFPYLWKNMICHARKPAEASCSNRSRPSS